MKYCISGRQPRSILAQADEIKLQYRDRAILIDYIHDFPDKTFILEVPKGTEDLEWETWVQYSDICNFILCIEDLKLVPLCQSNNIKFYWHYPVFSWYELHGLIQLSPCYILLGAPLAFDLVKVQKKTAIPLRMVPNLAFDAYIPRANGIKGSWVRPEDIGVYEEWISVFEFITEELSQERTLLHVYKDNGNWPGNLNLLFTNFNINVDNRALPDELGATRANCGQRCMINGACHFCDTGIQFASALRKKHYENKRSELKDADSH